MFAYLQSAKASVRWKPGLLTFRDTTLQTRVESISAEQRYDCRQVFEAWVTLVVLAKCLESRNAADWITRAGLDVIYVVIMYETEGRRAIVITRVIRDGL